MEDITKIAKSLEDSSLSLKGVSKTFQNEAKEQKGGILSMILAGDVLWTNYFQKIGVHPKWKAPKYGRLQSKTRKQLVRLHKTEVKRMTPVVHTDIPTKEILSQKRFSSC